MKEPEIIIKRMVAELLDVQTYDKLRLLVKKYDIDFIVLYPDLHLNGQIEWRGEPDLMLIKKHILELYQNRTA